MPSPHLLINKLYLQSFLGYVDLLGVTYSASTLASGYGAYIAQPLLRKAVEGRETTLTEEDALEVMETCLKVLFYRDARSLNKVRTKNGLFDKRSFTMTYHTSFKRRRLRRKVCTFRSHVL